MVRAIQFALSISVCTRAQQSLRRRSLHWKEEGLCVSIVEGMTIPIGGYRFLNTIPKERPIRIIMDVAGGLKKRLTEGEVRSMGKVYAGGRLIPGQRTLSETLITVDGKPLKHIVRHSPTGMNFGYGGSGPADLALSILEDVFRGRVELADLFYMEFKWEFVAAWGNSWSITEEEINGWLQQTAGNGIEELIRRFDALDGEQRLKVKFSREL